MAGPMVESDGDGPWLVVGLGNPGPKYAGNRHNVGARVVAGLAAELGARLGTHRSRAEVAEVRLPPRAGVPGPRLVLAVPSSFMNESGGPVSGLLRFFRIEPARLLVQDRCPHRLPPRSTPAHCRAPGRASRTGRAHGPVTAGRDRPGTSSRTVPSRTGCRA